MTSARRPYRPNGPSVSERETATDSHSSRTADGELFWRDLTPDKPYATYPCPVCRRRVGDSDNGMCASCAYDFAGVPE